MSFYCCNEKLYNNESDAFFLQHRRNSGSQNSHSRFDKKRWYTTCGCSRSLCELIVRWQPNPCLKMHSVLIGFSKICSKHHVVNNKMMLSGEGSLLVWCTLTVVPEPAAKITGIDKRVVVVCKHKCSFKGFLPNFYNF